MKDSRLVQRRTLSVRSAVLVSAVLLLFASVVLVPGNFFASAHAATCSEMLPNGDMETSSGWTASTNGSYSLFSDYQVHSGSQAAYLAGVNNADDSLSRSVTLPADSSVTLSFWWQVNSEESGSGYDSMTVLVTDESGQTQQIAYAVSDQNAGFIWQKTSVDLSTFGGQTIQLQFKAQTDGSLTTDFFVDDVSVSACADAPASDGHRIFLPWAQR